MSRLGDERSTILAALEAGGIRTATGGKLAAPCILLEPGDPWTEPRRAAPTRGRVSRWRLSAIPAAVDTVAAIDELAGMIDEADAALRTISGLELPSWARPIEQEIAGIRRAVSIATIQYASS